MKKLTIISAFLFVLILSFQSYAQDTQNLASNMVKKPYRTERAAVRETKRLSTKSVSNYSLSSFKSDFGSKSDVTWSRSDRFDRATFNQNGQEMSVYYDFEGNLLATSTVKTFNDLPLRGQNIITKKYEGYAVESVMLYDFPLSTNAQMLLFNSQFNDPHNYFVQLANGKEKIIVQVDLVGRVFLFKKL